MVQKSPIGPKTTQHTPELLDVYQYVFDLSKDIMDGSLGQRRAKLQTCIECKLPMSSDSLHKVAKYVALKTLIVCCFATL